MNALRVFICIRRQYQMHCCTQYNRTMLIQISSFLLLFFLSCAQQLPYTILSMCAIDFIWIVKHITHIFRFIVEICFPLHFYFIFHFPRHRFYWLIEYGSRIQHKTMGIIIMAATKRRWHHRTSTTSTQHAVNAHIFHGLNTTKDSMIGSVL